MELLLDLPFGKKRDKIGGVLNTKVRHDSKIQPRTLHYLDNYFVVTAVNGSDESNVSEEFSLIIGQ